jgi:DNA polymerase-3 subunit delta
MTEIYHQALQQYLKESGRASFAPVYLIYGEAFLYEQTVKQLVDAIIPDTSAQRHAYEIIRHQDSSQIRDAVEKLNTYAFFNQKKIVELRDSTIFVSARNQGNVLGKIKKTYDSGDLIQASRYYLELLARLKVDFNDLCEDNIADVLDVDANEFPDVNWLLTLTDEIKKKGSTAPSGSNDSGLLEKCLASGFPKNNHLIISTDTVDKRASLYQMIKQTGVIIDCTVSKGARKADKDIQRQALIDYMNRELKKRHKEITPDVFELLYEKIGFDIRNFAGFLEKVIQYTGERKTIHVQDVEAVSHPVRQDPLYELTGALLEKNTQKSIYYLSSLLDSGHHPLQILTAMANQIRRLLLIKDFLKNHSGSLWHSGMDFKQFQKNVVPVMQKFDDALSIYLNESSRAFGEKPEREAAALKKDIPSDLMLMKKDQHPYAVYILFQKAQRFDEKEISSALIRLSQADVAMKTSGQRPKSILEEVVIKICGLKNV